jgi:hypothetical protein
MNFYFFILISGAISLPELYLIITPFCGVFPLLCGVLWRVFFNFYIKPLLTELYLFVARGYFLLFNCFFFFFFFFTAPNLISFVAGWRLGANRAGVYTYMSCSERRRAEAISRGIWVEVATTIKSGGV